MSEKNEVVQASGALVLLTAQDVAARIGRVQEVMKGVMQGPSKENAMGVHYGLIPGCGDKPTLLQPGAQILGVTFGIYADPTETIVDMPMGHREVRVKVAMKRLDTDAVVAYGMGSCSTMEAKYRFRKGDAEITDQQVPKAYWDAKKADPKKAQDLIGGAGYGTKKVDGAWFITKGSSEKVENTNPAEFYNTVGKIAFKRAYVHGTINATACSDIFTQDIEDMAEVIRGESQFEVGPAPYHKPEETKTAPVEPPKPQEEPLPEKKVEKPLAPPVEEVKKPESVQEGDVLLTPETVASAINAFQKLSPELNEGWMAFLIGKPKEKWTLRNRSALMKIYAAINSRKIPLKDAIKSDSIDALYERAIA